MLNFEELDIHDKLQSDQRVETYLSKSNKIPYFRSSLSFKIVHPSTLILTFAEQLCAKDKYFVYRKKIERRKERKKNTRLPFMTSMDGKGGNGSTLASH